MKNELYLFVGTYAEASEAGIYLYRFDTTDGTATLVREISGIQNPSYLALSNDEQFLYAVSETSEPEASLFAYAVDKSQETLTLIGKQVTQGSAPCYVWIGSRCRLAVTANYRGGSMSVFPLADNGMPHPVQLYPFEGGTPGSSRQSRPHLHCVYASPDEKFLFANDLGTDRIYKYELKNDAEQSCLQAGNPAFYPLPKGDGPRHTIFHPNGSFVYILGELSGYITVMQYKKRDLFFLQRILADPLQAGGSADIHITPDGKFLYASNRLKGDGLAIFSIDLQSGMLTKVGYQFTGIHPRNFIITPDGEWLLCACRDSNIIQVFAIDKQTGLLTNLYKDIKVDNPVCLQIQSIHSDQ